MPWKRIMLHYMDAVTAGQVECLGWWAAPGSSQPTKMSSAAVQSTGLPRHLVRGCTLGRVGISALRPMQLFFCSDSRQAGRQHA